MIGEKGDLEASWKLLEPEGNPEVVLDIDSMYLYNFLVVSVSLRPCDKNSQIF